MDLVGVYHSATVAIGLFVCSQKPARTCSTVEAHKIKIVPSETALIENGWFPERKVRYYFQNMLERSKLLYLSWQLLDQNLKHLK